MALGATVGELQARMSAREFAEWMAYYSLEPWGDEYDALERAAIASTLANTVRDAKKRPQPYRPEEFLLRFKDEKKRPEPDALLEKVAMINRLMGGKDKR